jgi:hypothetical protein
MIRIITSWTSLEYLLSQWSSAGRICSQALSSTATLRSIMVIRERGKAHRKKSKKKMGRKMRIAGENDKNISPQQELNLQSSHGYE